MNETLDLFLQISPTLLAAVPVTLDVLDTVRLNCSDVSNAVSLMIGMRTSN